MIPHSRHLSTLIFQSVEGVKEGRVRWGNTEITPLETTYNHVRPLIRAKGFLLKAEMLDKNTACLKSSEMQCKETG